MKDIYSSSFSARSRGLRSWLAVGAACLVLSVSTSKAEQLGLSLIGFWSRGDGGAHIRVERCARGFCAVSTWTRPGDDDEKPGDRLEMALTLSEPAVWTGEAWDPQHNRSYKLRIEVGPREMVAHGCAMAGLVCKDVSWRRL